MNNKTDLELLEATLKGCNDSYIEIMGRYTEKVFNLASRITRNQQDAEEIVQDVFVAIYKKGSSFQGKSAFSSWVYRITSNACFMRLRKKGNSQFVPLENHEGNAAEWSPNDSLFHDVDSKSTRHELREALEVAINRLPDEYRSVFILRDVDGMSSEEVSQVIGLTIPAVKSRLHRARMMLRKKLQTLYIDYSDSDFISVNPMAASYALAA